MDNELSTIFSVLAAHYRPGRKSGDSRPRSNEEFLRDEFDLNDEEIEMIASEIDPEMNLNEKFDRLEQILEQKGFEKGLQHRDKGFSGGSGAKV